MYNISETYKNHIVNSITRKPKSKIIVDGTEYTGVTHLKTFPKIEHTTVDMFGSFPAKSCEFEIYNIGGSVELRGKEVSAYRALDIDGTVHWIPMGIFKAESKDITNNLTTKTIKFKGSDRSHLFDVTFNSALHTYPCKLLAFVKQLCANHSIILENEDFPFSDLELEKAPEFAEGITEREIIRKIAQLGGCIAQITREGKLKIAQPEVADIPITSSKYSSLSRENTIYVTGLALSQSEREDVTVSDSTYVGAYGEFVYKIKDNPFIKDRQSEVIDSIASCYLGRNITPFVINGFIDDFIYDLNDLITVRDKSGAEFITPLLSITTQSRIKSDFKSEVQKESSSSDGELEGSVKQEIKEANKNMNAYKNAQSALNELMANAMGLYISEVNDGAGGKIYYYHDTADIANATYIATINSNGFAFTSGSGCWKGGNPEFTNGITKEGNAILQAIYTHKLTASLIRAGRLESNDGSAYFDLDEGVVGIDKKKSETTTDENGEEVTELKNLYEAQFRFHGLDVAVDKSASDGFCNLSELEEKLLEISLERLGIKKGTFMHTVLHPILSFWLSEQKTGNIGVNVLGVDADGILHHSHMSDTKAVFGQSVFDKENNTFSTKKTGFGNGSVESNIPMTFKAPELYFEGNFIPRVLPKTDENGNTTDFDNIFECGPYVGESALGDGTNANYLHSPSVLSAAFLFEVIPTAKANGFMQRITTCSKGNSRKWERHYHLNSTDSNGSYWGEWTCVYSEGNTLLWASGWYMNESQTITLPEAISKQPHGIVLVFSYFDGSTAEDHNFNSFFISKKEVTSKPGCGHTFTMFRSGTFPFDKACIKYLYISDTEIKGHEYNIKSGTGGCGITYDNSKFVLRYVIGV